MGDGVIRRASALVGVLVALSSMLFVPGRAGADTACATDQDGQNERFTPDIDPVEACVALADPFVFTVRMAGPTDPNSWDTSRVLIWNLETTGDQKLDDSITLMRSGGAMRARVSGLDVVDRCPEDQSWSVDGATVTVRVPARCFGGLAQARWRLGMMTSYAGGDFIPTFDNYAGPVGRSAPVAVGGASDASGSGVWVGYANGDVQPVGAATDHGDATGVPLNAPVVGIAPTADGGGYWLLAQDGGVFSFGNATFHGSTGDLRLNKPIVSIASDPKGRGYWFVASDGGVFSFGAPFYGSAGNLPLQQPVVGMASTRSGNGYWLVARDGGIFSYGADAAFSGSTGNITLNQPIVGMAADPDGRGYWFVAADGGVFAFDASFYGSGVGSVAVGDHVVGMVAHPQGGYWLVTAKGAVLAFGAAGAVSRSAG